MSTSERLQACRILEPLLRGDGSLAQAFAPGASDATPLVRELCFGVCRWYQRLVFYAGVLLDKPLRGKDLDLYCLVLLGLYQLFFMRVPAHAAIHATVEECASLDKTWAKGLVNAVLRNAQRQQAELEERARQDYAAWYSHPQWLLDRLKQGWPQDYRAILEGNNARAPLTLRVNVRKTSREAYLDQLEQRGIGARAGLAPAAVMLDAPQDVLQLPGFADGLCSVQDEASQFAAALLPLAPGMRVLDACAAPGGKTGALLEREPSLQLVAVDSNDRRLTRVRENLSRLQLHAELRCADRFCS
jgi:16S rRNA (cytosine967-C5)-methyltransferase